AGSHNGCVTGLLPTITDSWQVSVGQPLWLDDTRRPTGGVAATDGRTRRRDQGLAQEQYEREERLCRGTHRHETCARSRHEESTESSPDVHASGMVRIRLRRSTR